MNHQKTPAPGNILSIGVFYTFLYLAGILKSTSALFR